MSGPASNEDDATAVVEPDASRTEDALDPGARVGRYLVIEELGRGGMGLVLRAYDPKLQREVALKRVRVHGLDDSAQARLVREARAMARLSHPNVVGVYDVEIGGPDSDVVVAMELVRGSTLRQWLAAAEQSWKDVVATFIAAGHGLVAAHGEGLLHRDFKLDNVLVGDDGRVRVTDFGLARATASNTSGDASDASDSGSSTDDDDPLSGGLTTAGMVMGTPRYMAPEQHESGQLDARTDQYAYCVALWRALTRDWPFDCRGRELLRAKRAGPPAWPSHVAVPRHVVHAIRRGLSPRPSDRWPTLPLLMGELGRDPRRARPRLLVAGALALIAVGIWGVQRLQRSRTAAACVAEGESIADTWNDARAQEIEAAFAASGIGYAADTWTRSKARLDAYAAEWSRTRRDVCERATLDDRFSADVADASRTCLDEERDTVEALLEQVAGPDATVVQRVGIATASLTPLTTCADEVALRQRAELPSDPAERSQVAALRSRLAQAGAARDVGHADDALQGAQAVLEEATTLGWAPVRTEARLQVSRALASLGRFDDAAAAAEEAFFEAGTQGRDEVALEASIWLVYIVGFALARSDDGLHWGRIGRMLVERQGHEHDLIGAGLLNNIGAVHKVKGEYAEALAAYDAALEVRVSVLGPDHPEVAAALDNAGTVHRYLHAYDKAFEAHRRAASIFEATLGPDHPEVAIALTNLGNVQILRGDIEDAVRLQERALAIDEKAFGKDHPAIISVLANFGIALQRRGDRERALEIYERVRTIVERSLGPDHPNIAMILTNIGTLHHDLGDEPTARSHYERALAIMIAAHGNDHIMTAMAQQNIGDTYAAERAWSSAIDHYEEALAIRERVDAPAQDIAETRFELAIALWESRTDRERALQLATAAADTFRTANADALARVEAWLATTAARRD